MMTATADEPRPEPQVLVKLDVGEYVLAMRTVEALGEAELMREGDRAGRPLRDAVLRNLARRPLFVLVPVSPVAPFDEDVIRTLALLSARKQCDDPEVVGFRWLTADEIDDVLYAQGISVVEVELRGTPRA